MATQEVKVPDIGDFKDVPVIEVLVKPGDAVKPEDALVTLESDKATMDVPSPAAGTVKTIAVKVGDKVSEGSLVVVLESAAPASAGRPSSASAPSGPASAGRPSSASAQPPVGPASAGRPSSAATSAAGAYAGKADFECEMLVLGAGPGGDSAAFRAADLGMKTVIVERYPTRGGVCLNVGCIPSKALLHVAGVIDETAAMAAHGVTCGKPQVDLAKLKGWKDKVVGKLTGGLAGMAKARKVEVVRGVGQFLDPHHVEVEVTEGTGQAKTGAKKVVRFQKAIIAVGSQVVRLPFIPDDPRVLASTSAPEL
ncbi:MAG TPA: FAD-dependent oxidoreductase, partial [Casimicrobiaceae bacterium]|nr:FAD-dependent oxidoreductase [Casimicrobiaceae bacterium]